MDFTMSHSIYTLVHVNNNRMLLSIQEFMIIDFRDRIIIKLYNNHPIYHFISIPLEFQRKHINGFIKTI